MLQGVMSFRFFVSFCAAVRHAEDSGCREFMRMCGHFEKQRTRGEAYASDLLNGRRSESIQHPKVTEESSESLEPSLVPAAGGSVAVLVES